MKNKYGVIQSTSTSCIFYKEDKDGNQSTFNIFVKPEEGIDQQVFAFIDNEQFKQQNWFGTNNPTIEDIAMAFKQWANDAPFLFSLDAQKSMNNCLGTKMKLHP